MRIARSAPTIALLFAAAPALAVDRTLCVDTVAEFGAAIDDAVSTDPAYDRVVVRLVQGNYDLSNSNAFTARSLRKRLDITGGWNAACNLRTPNPGLTTLRNTNAARGISWATPTDVALRGVSFIDFVGFLAINNGTTSGDTTQTVEFSDNRVLGGTGEIGARAESGAGLSLLLFKNNLIANRSSPGDCAVTLQGDSAADTDVRLVVANNTITRNTAPGGGLCVRQFEQPGFYNNVLSGSLPAGTPDLVGNGNLAPATFRNNILGSFADVPVGSTSGTTSADPDFVSPAAGDFRLQVGSPGINTGTNTIPTGIANQDVSGNPRFVGPSIDRGAFESAVGGAGVLTVTSTADSSSGTLRAAITAANSQIGPNRIEFNIGGSGCPKTIQLASALPQITDSLTVDGTTQPGYAPNTVDIGYDGQQCVLLRGGSGLFGLRVPASAPSGTELVVEGLAFGGFGYGIVLEGGNNHRIQGSHFGVDLGPSANDGQGGVWVAAADDVTIGGSDPAQRNVIAAQTGSGFITSAAILVGADSLRTEVVNNYIGVQPNGVFEGGNTHGIVVDGDFGTYSDNLVANSVENAIWLRSQARDNLVNLSRIGLPPVCIGNCPSSFGNGRGMLIEGEANFTLRNEIAFSSLVGVRVTGNDNSVTDTPVWGGSVLQAPIDIAGQGFTANDNDNVANPPAGNRGINFPVVLGVDRVAPTQLAVRGRLESVNGRYRIRAFAADRVLGIGIGRCEGREVPEFANTPAGATVEITNAPAGANGSEDFIVNIDTGSFSGRQLVLQALRFVEIDGTLRSGDSSEFGTCFELPLFGDGFEP
ncbi:MAG: hypothetical protein LW860_00705 [Xanthomonadaceae bacterium]|jgi:hypothetical protein|nr:hypothetical protein [Xanthomonadaceae bacterium]